MPGESAWYQCKPCKRGKRAPKGRVILCEHCRQPMRDKHALPEEPGYLIPAEGRKMLREMIRRQDR